MKKYFYLPTLLLLAACSAEAPVDTITPQLPTRVHTPRYDLELSTNEQGMASANNTFAFNLFQQVKQTESKHNIVLSPLSVSYVLSMTANGAVGTTLNEIKSALGFDAYSLDDINAFYQKLTDYLTTVDGETFVGIANSIWLNKGFKVLPEFTQVNQEYYLGEVQEVDMSKTATLRKINQWVNDKTFGCIPDLLSDIDPATRMMLINTLYFDGLWRTQFGNPKDETFTNEDGSKSVVKMLVAPERSYRYTVADGIRMIELPYGNATYSMVIMLPEEETDLHTIPDKFTQPNWKAWMEGSKGTLLNLTLPTFNINYERTLNQDVQALGIYELFSSSGADLSNISVSKPLFASKIFQKAYIKLDQYGTTATAATAETLFTDPGIIERPVPIDFFVNRPFYYIIKENSTQSILFIGCIGEL
ncbi:MAG: serpin family protein [Prevotellaceae bacterium]|jgi:serpin B|nr:serpin family protein [Prevotellaceae bacterium]